ncbi:MAG: hypothetical protein ACFN4A_09665 [Streptococcus mutans]
MQCVATAAGPEGMVGGQAFDLLSEDKHIPLEELQQLVGNSLSTGASMNFSSANPPFAINPRWVKKVTLTKRQ